jgi:hypothetical protein
LAVVGLALAAGTAWSDGQSSCGTSISFYPTPSEAATAAVKAEKLVFVLHVSGHFEDPGLT